MTTMARDGLVVTAQQGDADDREKDRNSPQNSTIHRCPLSKITGT
jgi:hypothetical protein